MELYSLALIVRWIIPAWLLGWLLLPAARSVFPTLSDGGLAAGRMLAVMLISLLAFWAASLRFISLTHSPLMLVAFPLFLFVFSLRTLQHRHKFFAWVKAHKRALIFSDAVFLLAFIFFVYLRLCQPEIREQEKPMDSAIIGVLARSTYLPADNPWFSGVPFTNYYYFGHFMAATLMRAFSTPLPYAYNLIQPIFCAFFVSILWSLCATLTRSSVKGVLVALMVAFCGNYEPARQMLAAWKNHAPLWPLDWWTTSRVVPHTINEYPFFTLALGDAHAHFFGLVLGVLFLCLCHSLSCPKTYRGGPSIFLIGITLGAIIITNAWDAPLYFVLSCLVLAFSESEQGKSKLFLFVTTILSWALSALFTASFFLLNFKPAISGFAFEFWLPPSDTFLHWGAFFFSGTFIVLFHIIQKKRIIIIPNLSFCIFLVGAIAFAIPCVFYIRGYFEGDLKHQDTIFKFWLQSWLFLAIALCSKVVDIVTSLPGKSAKSLPGIFCLTIWVIPFVCTVIVFQGRAASTSTEGVLPLSSLNGARHLGTSDQRLISLLQDPTYNNAVIVEAVGQNTDGSLIGGYSDFGRISYLTGIPTYLGWPQHAAFWGVSQNSIKFRARNIRAFYLRNGSKENSNLIPKSQSNQPGFNTQADYFANHAAGKQRFIVWGELENTDFGALSSHLKPRPYFSFQDRSSPMTTYLLRLP